MLASCHQIFISLYLKVFIKNLVQIGKVASEKIRFEFLYVHDLGPRSRNDLDLQYSHTFIYSTRKSALKGTYTPGWCPFLSINIF